MMHDRKNIKGANEFISYFCLLKSIMEVSTICSVKWS